MRFGQDLPYKQHVLVEIGDLQNVPLLANGGFVSLPLRLPDLLFDNGPDPCRPHGQVRRLKDCRWKGNRSRDRTQTQQSQVVALVLGAAVWFGNVITVSIENDESGDFEGYRCYRERLESCFLCQRLEQYDSLGGETLPSDLLA